MANRRKRAEAVRPVQVAASYAQGDVREVLGTPASAGAIPLRVVATMRGPITAAPMLDALLASVIAQRGGAVAGFGPLLDVEVPIAREPLGRFHLASGPIVSWESHEMRWVNRKFPLAEGQLLGDDKLKRVHISGGACKSYRIPHEVRFAEGGLIAWYCVGDAEEIRALLMDVTHLGRRRAVGRGAVASWMVEETEPWDGFPVVEDGRVLRPLPVDWPGIIAPKLAMHTLTYPYWEHAREEMCAVPVAP